MHIPAEIADMILGVMLAVAIYTRAKIIIHTNEIAFFHDFLEEIIVLDILNNRRTPDTEPSIITRKYKGAILGDRDLKATTLGMRHVTHLIVGIGEIIKDRASPLKALDLRWPVPAIVALDRIHFRLINSDDKLYRWTELIKDAVCKRDKMFDVRAFFKSAHFGKPYRQCEVKECHDWLKTAALHLRHVSLIMPYCVRIPIFWTGRLQSRPFDTKTPGIEIKLAREIEVMRKKLVMICRFTRNVIVRIFRLLLNAFPRLEILVLKRRLRCERARIFELPHTPLVVLTALNLVRTRAHTPEKMFWKLQLWPRHIDQLYYSEVPSDGFSSFLPLSSYFIPVRSLVI